MQPDRLDHHHRQPRLTLLRGRPGHLHRFGQRRPAVRSDRHRRLLRQRRPDLRLFGGDPASTSGQRPPPTSAPSLVPRCRSGARASRPCSPGDTNYGGSSSPVITQVVSMGATSTTVGDTAGTTNPSPAGMPTSYIATITPSQGTAILPTGTVAFCRQRCPDRRLHRGGGHPRRHQLDSPLQRGQPVHAGRFPSDHSRLQRGLQLHHLRQHRRPVQPAGHPEHHATTVAGPGPGHHGAGQPVNFTATVTAGGIGLGNQLTPTGTVTFSDGSGNLCTAPVSAASPGIGSAACTFSSSRFHRQFQRHRHRHL